MKSNQYPPINKPLITELYNIYYFSYLKEKNIEKFIEFVLDNKEKINNPKYFFIIIETIQFNEDYFNKYYDFCFFTYNFLIKNGNISEYTSTSFTSSIKFSLFIDLFENYLNQIKRDIK